MFLANPSAVCAAGNAICGHMHTVFMYCLFVMFHCRTNATNVLGELCMFTKRFTCGFHALCLQDSMVAAQGHRYVPRVLCSTGRPLVLGTTWGPVTLIGL